MNYKKIIAALLSLTLTAGFFGCTESETSTDVTPDSVSDTADDTADTSNTTDKTTDKQTTAPEPEVIVPTSHTMQFTSEKDGIYNYCPSVMQVSDDKMYIYYCTNSKSYNVTDYIGFREATKNPDGTWTWSEEKIVLSPTAGTWDSRHVCDPSVVMGDFTYNGEKYSYLMAYLGCLTSNSQENEIGIAVAKNPDGPFVKVGNKAFIEYNRDMTINQDLFQWGVGQPSLINMDKSGEIMIFYTKGIPSRTCTIVESWNLSDLNNPVRHSSVILSERGLYNLNNGADIINNADFVYDAEAKRFYASSDCHPNPSSEPSFISSTFRITYFDKPSSYASFAWRTLCTVGEKATGFARNHNTGILRDGYGHLPNDYISVYYTVSITGTGNTSLWTYRIYDYHVKKPK